MMRLLLACLVVLAGAGPARAQELTVSAAISMKEAVEEVGRRFMEAHPGVRVHDNFGGSGELAQQIEAGAPVDVFVSAAQAPVDELAARGLVVAASRRLFARNVLVVITPADDRRPTAKPEDLAGPGVTRIAVGNPRAVPAGQYAEESLRALGLWERLRPRLVLAENVRQVLEYVARGEVDAGVVYATDVATARGRVRERFRLPEGTHRPIVYPAAVVAGSRQRALAQAFVDLLAGSTGRAVLARLGFAPAPGVTR